MSLAKVSKIHITAHQKDQDDILEILQNLGFTQIEDYAGAGTELEKSDLNEKISELDYKIAGIKFCLDFLADYETGKKSLVEKLNPKINLTLAEIEQRVENFDHQGTTKEIQAIESGINEANNIREKLNQELELITPWQNLDFIPNQTNQESGFNFKFVSAAENLYSDLINKIQKELPLSTIEKTAEHIVDKKKEILAVIFFAKEKDGALSEILTGLNVNMVDLPKLEIAIPKRIQEINQEITEAQNRIGKLEKEAEHLAINQRNLKITFDYLNWQKEKLAGRQKAGNTEQTFSLIGWIDESLIELLKKELGKETNDFVVEKLPIKEDETAPVVFKNKLFKDYEAITTLYGTPQANEPDPTPFLAPFFTLFFGMAMTDAGYGLIIAGGIYGAIKLLKIPRASQKLLRVLMYGGVATFILGALTGGWFSIDLETLPVVISAPLKAIQIIDPIKSPLTIFYLALALGVLQVLFGLGINTYWKVRDKKIIEGLTGSGAWLLTIVSVLIFAGGNMGAIPAVFSQIGKWLAILGAILIVYGGTRGTKNIFLKPGTGILSLYSAVGYFSDILSYSRLLALGLTTTIIGTVVNIIAGLVYGIPFVGWLAALIVLIGGHTFNIAINALGAFIHSARLQFIEFFPKFLKAGGIPFEPFRKEARYVRLTRV